MIFGKKADGPRKAYIESVPVVVTNGKVNITFTRQVENPAIKTIEILPQSGETKTAIRINAGAGAAVKDSAGHQRQADTSFKNGSVNPGTVGEMPRKDRWLSQTIDSTFVPKTARSS